MNNENDQHDDLKDELSQPLHEHDQDTDGPLLPQEAPAHDVQPLPDSEDAEAEADEDLPSQPAGYRPEISYLSRMYRTWFLDYASYVILERAVPHIDDGLKPVQRRILHCMHIKNTNRLIKVNNIVGDTMKYHPHGDASITDALVQIGQKGYLIDTQGNWGNILTGDQAAAGRYIEAKLSDFALEALYGDSITTWKRTYDGSQDEPIALPVRFPLLLAQGAEGIAVGLSSKILPHNFVELCQAACDYLRGEEFTLYPDFPTGGLLDVARYNDGERGGSVRSRAKIEKIDSRTLSITELPAGKTTSSLIESILKAVEKGKIRIKRVDDMTAATTDIRIQLAAGVSSDKAIDALYAFTECELSISPNCCVIYEDRPLFTNVSELLRYGVERTKRLFDQELRLKLGEREEQYLHASLERIFIEERIYKDKGFEDAASEDEALRHIAKRIEPFADRLLRPVTAEDLKRLLEIRMARILRFNLPKHEAQMLELEQEIDRLKHDIKHIVDYTIRWYEYLISRYGERFPRRTKLTNFSSIAVTKVAELDSKLYIDRTGGFVGTGLRDGEFVCNCSSIDDIILFFRSGRYQVMKVEDKRFYGREEVIHVDRYLRGDDRTIYNVVYQDGATGASYIKRFNLQSIIRDRVYDLTRGSDKSRVLYFTANGNGEAEKITIKLKVHSHKQRLFEFERDFSDIPIKGKSAVGLLVTKAAINSVKLLSKGFSTLGGRQVWFDRDIMRLNYNGQGEYLGEFDARDRILVILPSGECYTTDFSDSNHFEEHILRIEKHDERKLWTAIYWDEEQGYPYIKRFPIEHEQRREAIVSEGAGNSLMLLTDTYYPRLVFAREAEPEEGKATEIEVEEFAMVKSIRARGKRLATFRPELLREIEPLRESPLTAPTAGTSESDTPEDEPMYDNLLFDDDDETTS